jgi:chromosome segregation ATPase
MATDIAANMSNQMGSVMQTAVTDKLSPLLDNIKIVMEKFVNDMGEKNTKAVDEMLNKYVGMLSGTFAQEIQDITQLIKETGNAQANIKAALVQFGDHLNEQYNVQDRLVDKTMTAVKYLHDNMGGLASCAAEIKDSSSTLKETADLLSQTAGALSGMKDLHDNLENLTKTLTQSVGALMSHINNMLDRMGSELGNHLTAALNSFDGKLAEVLSRFSATLAETRDTIEELPKLLGVLSGSIGKIETLLTDRSGEIDKIVKSAEEVTQVEEAAAIASGAAGGIQSAITSLEKWLSRFEESAKEALAAAEKLTGLNGEETDTIEAKNEGVMPDADNNGHHKAFAEALEKSVATMTSQLDELRRELREGALHKLYLTQGQTLDTTRDIRNAIKSIETTAGNISKGLAELRGPDPGKKGGLGGILGR